MYDYDEGLHAAIDRRRAAEAETWPFPGRHESHDEIADETPIFHSLTVGGWRSRQRGSGRAVRSVHRPTVRRRGSVTTSAAAIVSSATASVPAPAHPRATASVGSASPARDSESLAGFRFASEVPAQGERRRDVERAADRAAIMDLLGGAGRHRLGSAV